MTPSNFKIAIKHMDEMTLLLITTSDHEFIALACMRDMQNNFGLEVLIAVARPTFGYFLYQSMAKYANILGKGITSSRDGCTLNASINIWKKLSATINPNNKRKLPISINQYVIDELSDSASEHELQALSYSYSIPASKAFINSLVFLSNNNNTNEAIAIRKVIDASKVYFSTSFNNNSSSWIDKDLPINKENPIYSNTIKCHVGDILIDKGTFLSVLNDIKCGRLSRSMGLIECAIDIDGDLVFFDGHHRYVEAILKGESHVLVRVVHSEYVNGFISDIERPNKNDIISIKDIYTQCASSKAQMSSSLFNLTTL